MKSKTLTTLMISIGVLVLALVAGIIVSKALARKHFSEKPALPQISSPAEVSAELEQLTPGNAGNLQELSLLAQKGNGMVVALAEAAGSHDLLAVCEDGTFYRWDIMSKKIIAAHTFFAGQTEENLGLDRLPVYRINAGVSFSKDGLFVITPSEISPDGLIGLNIWNTDSKERLDCEGEEKYCPDWGPSDDTVTSLILHTTRDLYFNAFKGSVDSWYGFASEKGKGGSFNIRRGTFGSPQIIRLAIDPLGDYLAVADDAGNIQVGDISAHKQPILKEEFYGFSHEVNYRLSNLSAEKITTVDLKFDETHSWLAWLNDKDIVMWSLRNYVFPLHFRTELKDGNAICFDRTGQILTVATQNGIKIFEVGKKKQIAEYAVGEVTALYFSNDNRLFVWGDSDGNIHLWGVR